MKQSDNGQVISLIPSAKTYYERAMIAYGKHDFLKAKHHFETGISLAANQEEKVFGTVQLALIYQHTFDFKQSILILNDLSEDESAEYGEVDFFQAVNYLHLKEYEAALSLVDNYINTDPSGSYRKEADEMKQKIIEELSKK